MTKPSSPHLRLNVLFFALHYLLLLPLFWSFTRQYGFSASVLQGIWMTLTLLSYPAVYLAPGLALSSLCLLSARRALVCLGLALALLWTSATELLLVLDAIILRQFDFHLNGLVVNLLLTPGGFEAMGLDGATLVPAGLGIALAFAANTALLLLLHRGRGAVARLGERLAPSRRGPILAVGAALAAMVLASMLILAFADFYSLKPVLVSTHSYPFSLSMRMRSLLRAVGCQEPPRERSLFAADANAASQLNYPDIPIRRQPPRRPPNIVWLTAESLRADLLAPEVMPNAWALAQRSVQARSHLSGGHGTRPAMFAMFYGLYGNNWNSFLNSRRPPVLFDWLHQDRYDFLVQTSARFTYPEFDQTIFSSIPSQDMKTFSGKVPWQRDVDGADSLVQFLATRTADRPFFAFHFFEGTHAPYTFDESRPLTRDYLPDINYATVSAKDATRVRNRQVNAAHDVDRQIGRILAAIASNPAIADHTIIIVTGDHGEEFFEHGRLGHNSTFVNEQIRTPLVIHLPGEPPQTITRLTHHTDIIATLAPRLGVQNPPRDFCVGQDITSPDYSRSHYIVCGWNIEAFVTKDHKYIIPTGAGAKHYGKNLFSADDQPLAGDAEDRFLRTHAAALFSANQEMHHFLIQDDD